MDITVVFLDSPLPFWHNCWAEMMLGCASHELGCSCLLFQCFTVSRISPSFSQKLISIFTARRFQMAGEASAPRGAGRRSRAVAGTGAGRAALGPEKPSPGPAGRGAEPRQPGHHLLLPGTSFIMLSTQREAPPAVGCEHPADPGTPALVPGISGAMHSTPQGRATQLRKW